jgi:hypothetical protein
VWGGASESKLDPLFKAQKKCILIIFCDKKAYLNKLKTCARTRTLDEQRSGHEFYKKEHTKPLFNENSTMNVHNLYLFHCINFKMLSDSDMDGTFLICHATVDVGKIQ